MPHDLASMNRVSIAHPDVTLMLDLEGVIREASLSPNIPDEGVHAWRGRPWPETVEGAASEHVRRMVEDARSIGVSAFRAVPQRFPSGRALPIEYTTVRLGGEAGLIAVGKTIRAVAELQSSVIAAQQSREQDYWKLREIETRSRLIFDGASEPVVVLRGGAFRIVEANPAAIRSLGIGPGMALLPEIAPRDRDALAAMLARAEADGRAPAILVHMGAEEAPTLVRASLMTAEPEPVFLLRLAPAGGSPPRARALAPRLDELVEALPDAFVVVDRGGVVRHANRAFLDLIQAGSEGGVIGQRLSRWLTRPGADASVLLTAIRQHGAVRLFPSALSGELGLETEVEISAAPSGSLGASVIGLLIRDVSRRLAPPAGEMDPAIPAAIADGIGRMPLPELVRGAVAVMERQAIEAALTISGGNRKAAAQLLGLSRQSLYDKLERYGIAREPEA